MNDTWKVTAQGASAGLLLDKVHANIHECMHAQLLTNLLLCMHTHTRARAHTHTHTRTQRQTDTNAHTDTRTRAHTHRCIPSWRLLGKCWVHMPWKYSGFKTKERGISSRARAHTHTHTHTHRYVCRGYRSQDKGFLLEGALQHVLVPQGRGRGVLRVDVGVLCVDVGCGIPVCGMTTLILFQELSENKIELRWRRGVDLRRRVVPRRPLWSCLGGGGVRKFRRRRQPPSRCQKVSATAPTWPLCGSRKFRRRRQPAPVGFSLFLFFTYS